MVAPTQAQRAQLEPIWVSYREATQISGLGRTTLWKLVSSSQIKAARVGRAVRINRQSLEEYMESQSFTGDSE
jgi:excisionase family DNA binding protein